MKKAVYPITFAEFQRFLNVLGYGMSRHDQACKTVIFELESGKYARPHYPNPLTIRMPDFICPHSGDLAYEKDYVVDILHSVLGELPAGEIVFAIRNATPPPTIAGAEAVSGKPKASAK